MSFSLRRKALRMQQINRDGHTMPLISAQNLYKQFGSTRAVEDFFLEVPAGEIYALMGPDGAGKTTIMRLLSGILRPDQGSVTLGGIPLAERPEDARANIGYLAQSFSLYEDLTVLENIRFFAEVRGVSGTDWHDRAAHVLRFVDMEAFSGRLAGALSGGMKQKLALAVAMVSDPPILLLDEPTGGVDPITRQAFWMLITRLLSQGVAVILTTPYMDEAARCHRVGFMFAGRMILEGSPQDLTRDLEGRTFMLRGSPLRSWAIRAGSLPEVEVVQPFGDNLHLILKQDRLEQGLQKLKRINQESDELSLEALESIPTTLEDAFVSILHREESL
jgi:ABC-2 type transport system ATP-binding protein